jgi:uncharacterized protein with PhoU and TrkA domain
MDNDQTTPQDAQEALKKILNLKNPDNPDYDYIDPKDSEIQDIVQTPKDKLQTSIGIREDGVLNFIDPAAKENFYFNIAFSGTQTFVNAKLMEGLGFNWTPEGHWEKDEDGFWIYVVDEEVEMKLKAINQSNQWEIIGVKNPLTIIPGADSITRGNSQIIIYNDYTSITNGEKVATIEQDAENPSQATNNYLQEVLDDSETQDSLIAVKRDEIILKRENSEEQFTNDHIILINGEDSTGSINEEELRQLLENSESSIVVIKEDNIIIKKTNATITVEEDDIVIQKGDSTSIITLTDDLITLINGDATVEIANNQITMTIENAEPDSECDEQWVL